MIEYTPTPDFYNDYICHSGVKGMKWGKRKSKKEYDLGKHSKDMREHAKDLRARVKTDAVLKKHNKKMQIGAQVLRDDIDYIKRRDTHRREYEERMGKDPTYRGGHRPQRWGEYIPVTGESLSSGYDYDKKKKKGR